MRPLFALVVAVFLAVTAVPLRGEPAPEAPPRPTEDSGEFELISCYYPSLDLGGVVIEPPHLDFNLAGDPLTGDVATLRLTVRGVDDTGARSVLNAEVTDFTPLPGTGMKPPLRMGQAVPVAVEFDAYGRLVLEPLVDDGKLGRNEPTWFGVRPPKGWPEHGDIPDDAGPLGIRGPWVACERFPVRLTPDEILIGTSNWQAMRLRIRDWDDANGFARITAEYTAGFEPDRVGQTVRLLLRREVGLGTEAYSIALFPTGAWMPNDWPTSFDYTEDHPVQVLTFARPRPNLAE